MKEYFLKLSNGRSARVMLNHEQAKEVASRHATQKCDRNGLLAVEFYEIGTATITAQNFIKQ